LRAYNFGETFPRDVPQGSHDNLRTTFWKPPKIWQGKKRPKYSAILGSH